MAYFSIRRAIVVGFLIALAIICFFAIYTWMNVQVTERDNERINEIAMALRTIEALKDDLENLEADERVFVISGDSSFLAPYHTAMAHLARDTQAMRSLVNQRKDRGGQDMEELLRYAKEKAAFTSGTVRLIQANDRITAQERIQSLAGKALLDSFNGLATQVQSRERDVLNKYYIDKATSARQTSSLFFVLAMLFIVFLILFFFLVRRDVRRRLNSELNNLVSEKTVEFKDILDRVSDGLMAVDKNWNIVYINKAITDHIQDHDLLGRNIWDVFPEFTGSAFHEAYHRAMETQENVSIEAYFPKSMAWYENHIYPSAHGLTIHSRDITEKKITELKLQEANERFNKIVNATNDVLWEVDLQNNTMWWNDNYFKEFGYHPQSNGDNTSWQQHIHPDDRELVIQEVREAIKDKNRDTLSGEYRFEKADGTYANIYNRCYIMRDNQGKAYRLIGSMLNVTSLFETRKELQKTEEQYKLLVEQATDGIFIAGEGGRFIVVNSSGLLMSQYSMEELKMMTIHDLADKEELKHRPFDFAQLASDAGARSERKMIKKDGTAIDVEINAKYLPDGRFLAFIRDIAHRKQVEKAILRSNERFELISKATNDALWEWEFGSGKGWANNRHQSLYGLTMNDPVPDHELWLERIHEDDREKIRHSFDAAMTSTENVWIAEYRFYSGQGQWINIYDRTYILRDSAGRPIRMTGSMMDITTRKTAEMEISKARELADKLIYSLPGVFYFFDEKGKFIRWNKKFETVTGYSAAEISGMHPTDLFEGEEKKYIANRIREAFIKGENDAEANFTSKDGNKIPYYFKAALVMYEGRPCLLGTGIDISERKNAEEELRRSEKKYRLLFHDNPMPMWMLALPDLQIIDVNEAAINHYGYTREEFLSINSANLRPKSEISRYLEVAHQDQKGVRYSSGWHHIKKDGTLIDVEIFSHEMDYDNKPVRLVLSNDVTEKNKINDALKESLESIRNLTDYIQNIREEERTNIAREIHDELGQQLTVLKMEVSWIAKRISINEDDTIHQKLKSLSEMLDGTVKTVRRISSELRPSLLDDLGLVAAMDWHLKEFEKRSGILTRFTEPLHDLSMPGTVKTGLYRIFQESLTNVARHAEARYVKVSLQEIADHFVLEIEDDGKGFDKTQVDAKKTLGILGMKERTTMMGGVYEIRSDSGKGTKVVVSVPVIKEEQKS